MIFQDLDINYWYSEYMRKSLILPLFLALVLLINPAWAQQDNLSKVSAITDLSATSVKVAPRGAYNMGVGPINLRPGGYIRHDKDSTASTTTAGRKSYPDGGGTSVQAFNSNAAKARIQTIRVQNKGSLIKSPFPSGFGQ